MADESTSQEKTATLAQVAARDHSAMLQNALNINPAKMVSDALGANSVAARVQEMVGANSVAARVQEMVGANSVAARVQELATNDYEADREEEAVANDYEEAVDPTLAT